MSGLRDFLKRITLTHVLLFAVVVFLFLTWKELRTVNKNLVSISGAAHGIDGDLTNLDSDFSDLSSDFQKSWFRMSKAVARFRLSSDNFSQR